MRTSLPWIQTTLLKLISKVQLLMHALDNWICRWSRSYVIILVHLRVVCYLMIWSYLGMKDRTSKGVGVWEIPWRHGGPARMSGSRWKPKPVWLRFSFGLHEQPILKWTPMMYTESDLDVLYMDGNIISRSFQWNQFQAQIHLESTGIVCTSWHLESVLVLCHYFGPMGRVSRWSPLGTRPTVRPWT
jgi:hypothetical protein